VRVFESDVRDHHTRALDLIGLEERNARRIRKSAVGRHTVITDHRCGKDEDLSEVRWVGHRVGIYLSAGADPLKRCRLTASDTGREDSLSEPTLLAPEMVAVETLSGL
jgi:hypothetical protein